MAGAETTRVVVIVSRDQPELYEYFRQGFAGLEAVEVVVDRRADEAPGESSTKTDGNRRWQRDVSAELALRGFVIARFP